MNPAQPSGSAIGKLLDSYRLQITRLTECQLLALYHKTWSAEVHETQILGFSTEPSHDALIDALCEKRECELQRKSPLEIDALLDEISP